MSLFASRQSDGAQRLNLRSARRAQRAALHRHRVHHPARTRIRLRASRHCHRNPAADADRHQVGQPRLPLPDDLRQTHRPRVASGTNPPHRLCRPTHRAASQGLLLYPARLYGGRGQLPGPSRGQRLAHDGQTNVDDLTLACPRDNRSVKPGGWRTRKRKDGGTEWIPPPHPDSGQSRVNDYHHPENYLLPDDEDESWPTSTLARSRSPSAGEPPSCRRPRMAARRRRTAPPWLPWPARTLVGRVLPSA